MSLVEQPRSGRTIETPIASIGDPTQQQEEDRLYGALLRRKWLLVLFALLGIGVGALLYKRQVPIYESSLKLMIWNQAPPRLVESDAFLQPSTTGKHEHLIVSGAVLEKACDEGKLETFKSLEGATDPIRRLKSIVRVTQIRDAVDTLELSATGAYRNELPEILAEVVNAYTAILEEDTETLSRDMANLMEALQENIEESKGAAEAEYFELFESLEIRGSKEGEEVRNPFREKVITLYERLSEAEEKQRSLQDSVDALPTEEATQAEANALIKVTAMEAAQYFGYARAAPIQSAAQKIEVPIQEVDSRISELELKIGKAISTVGENHPTVKSLQIDLEYFQAKREALLEEQTQLEAEQALTTEEEPSLLEITDTDRDLIRMYASSLQRELETQQRVIDDLREEIGVQEQQSDRVAADISRLNLLAKEISQKDEVVRGIVNQLSEFTVLQTDYSSTNVRVIDAPTQGQYVAPQPTSYGAFGALVGLVLGVGVVMLLDWSEQSFHNPKQIHDRLRLNVLARIPEIRRKAPLRKRSEHISLLNDPHSEVAEGYRTCRTTLHFAMNSTGRTLLVTSPSAGDGKSTTAANLAAAFAKMGQRVVLVDADLRRPRAHVYLDEDLSPGLQQLADGSATAEDIIRPNHLVENLSLVTAGGHFSDPAEFLESPKFQDLIEKLKEEFDYVVVDSPPVLPVADTLALAPMADSILYVFRIRRGVALSAEKGVDMLRMVDANLIGVVVNGIDRNCFYSDYGKYGYNGYGSQGYFARRYYEADNKTYHELPNGNGRS